MTTFTLVACCSSFIEFLKLYGNCFTVIDKGLPDPSLIQQDVHLTASFGQD